MIWNTTQTILQDLPANCTLQAMVSNVLNETNLANNNCTCDAQISIKGDIDASGKVNIVDVSLAAKKFDADLEVKDGMQTRMSSKIKK